MPRLAKKLISIPLAALAVAAIGATPAGAASTRAEYIAQVDPICQSFMPDVTETATAYQRNYKRWLRQSTHGTLKAWVKQTRRTGESLSRYNQVHIALTDQLEAVTPAPGDEAAIGAWLGHRRRAEAFGVAAATALSRIQPGRFFKRIGQAGKAEVAGVRVASGIGFTVCDHLG